MAEGLEANYRKVLTICDEICKKTGRPVENVQLIAVSKSHTVEAIREIYDLGQRVFGESRAQELVEKFDLLPKDINWHFVGRLQRNKVKYIIDKICFIHSLDSLELAQEISRQATQKNVNVSVLAQLNLGGESSKTGFSELGLKDALAEVAGLPGLKVVGLMTIGPYHDDPEGSRDLFSRLAKLSGEAVMWQIPGVDLKYLSMGMSHDYHIAIEEGANFIRVGTGIFGYRGGN